MEYVMVPVPEELVGEVQMFMSWNLAAPKLAENPDAVRTVLDEVAPEIRELITHTARITTEGEIPTLVGVAEACDMTTWEVIGRLTELASRLQAAGRPSWFILPQVDQRPRPEGVSEWDHRVLRMTDADADLVQQIQLSELDGETHPG